MGETYGTFKKLSRAVSSAAEAGAPRRRMRLSPHAIRVGSCPADAEAVKPRLQLLRAGRPSTLITHTQAISFLSLPRPAASLEAPGGDRSPASRSDALCCPLSPLCAAKGHLTVPDERSFCNHGNC